MKTENATTCVFYDGACPLCSREVKLYKKLAARADSQSDIDWIDISQSDKELKAEGIHYEDAMRMMHIKDASGIHQVGIDAVLGVWDQLPYYRKLSKFLRRIPGFHPVLARAYEFVARHRLGLSRRAKP